MPAKSRVLAEKDVRKMTCDKLRKELKSKRLSVVGKKSDLQSRLVEYLNNQTDEQQNAVINEEPEEDHHQQDEVANIDEPMETEDTETPFNRTFTVEEAGDEAQNRSIHERTPTNAVGLVLDEDAKHKMCADLGIDLQNFEVKSRPRTHRASSRKSLRAATTSDQSSEQLEEPIENREATPIRQREASTGRDRFALLHAKEMEKEETLGERRERMQKRHEDLTTNVPDAFKRLATPKSVKKREPLDRSANRSAGRNWMVQNPAQMTFKFGEDEVSDFASVANSRKETGECSSSSTANVTKKPASRARARVDVKQLTRIPGPSRNAITPRRGTSKNIISSTVPEDDTFTDYISTPKGSTPNRVPKRGGYTPHTSKKVFVDTTQLTDREYTLAMEEGLIPGRPTTMSKLESRQLENKKRRDDIIALKRKMNIK
ncbi:hypothetical protein GCK72_014494 [Caenorhabditis remanei]|uniref:SAP domain-containing protein n=1 Tax=Caenorhabditis remanei TaxID=31234 RepID=A0A6A5GTW3_CAERE|nr:hypothetical protein GCK72_014494 [Caenorhabditis remanei]KAF1758036.1 hypothetical protein GCK72_014494 [Caenorhabditis remanei]